VLCAMFDSTLVAILSYEGIFSYTWPHNMRARDRWLGAARAASRHKLHPLDNIVARRWPRCDDILQGPHHSTAPIGLKAETHGGVRRADRAELDHEPRCTVGGLECRYRTGYTPVSIPSHR
jgi:hypothetical protein